MESKRMAGFLAFIGGLEVILGIMLAEFLYPGYNVSGNYISDLGVWDKPSAVVFNPALFIYGSIIIAAAYLLWKGGHSKIVPAMFALSGAGAIGVALFNETAGAVHALFALIAFLFGSFAAILSYRMTTKPFSYISIVLGATSLTALVLFALNIYLGLGVGGMERMIAYPVLLWSLGFGGYLFGQAEW